MDSRKAIQLNLDMADFVGMAYLQDLTDAELFHRPCDGGNHIAWQLGHLIVSEHELIEKVCPGTMPALPAGLLRSIRKPQLASNKPGIFDTKAALISAFRIQREGTLKNLATQSDTDLDRPTGLDYAPTVGGPLFNDGITLDDAWRTMGRSFVVSSDDHHSSEITFTTSVSAVGRQVPMLP